MRSLLSVLVVLGFTSAAYAQGTCYCSITCPVQTTLPCVTVCPCPDDAPVPTPTPIPTPSPTPTKAATWYVKGGKLYDACGERVILKGVNQLGQYIDEGGASMPAIAKTGANAVRIFWYVTRGQGVAGIEPLIKAA